MIEAVFGEHVWWYLTRSTGLVAWVVLSGSLIWGLLISGGTFNQGPARVVSMEMHRFLGTLAVVFTGLHLVTLLPNSFVPFSVGDLFIPFASDWSPLAVAWGVTAFYLLVAIQLTSEVMKWLPRTLWRAVHMTSFPLFVLATVHLLTAGTDAGNPLVIFAAVSSSVFIVLLTGLRIAFARADQSRREAIRMSRLAA